MLKEGCQVALKVSTCFSVLLRERYIFSVKIVVMRDRSQIVIAFYCSCSDFFSLSLFFNMSKLPEQLVPVYNLSRMNAAIC